jgi:pyruvate dehydrogenase E2 component (dihydrolipoamide acetyltransferase)
MAVEVIMPAMEMGQDSARIVRWLKNEGDSVSKGESLLEIETDKVTVEIEATASGTLSTLMAEAGDEVPVGVTIAQILADGEAPQAGPDQVAANAEDSPPAKAPKVLASPKARRLAAEAGIDLADLASTSGGPLRASDVAAAGVAPAGVPSAYAPPAERPGYRTIPLEGVRRRVAERLTASYREAPHITLRRSFDASSLIGTVDELRSAGRGASILAGIAAATARSLVEHPLLNAHFAEDEVRIFDQVVLGIAVALDDGLVVPVLRGAERNDVPAIAEQIEALAGRARAGSLQPADVRDGTFTISNLGMFAVDDFTPILNPPQVAILAVGTRRDVPVDVLGTLTMHPAITLALVVDHRAVDGAVAAAFLTDLVTRLEQGEPRA